MKKGKIFMKRKCQITGWIQQVNSQKSEERAPIKNTQGYFRAADCRAAPVR